MSLALFINKTFVRNKFITARSITAVRWKLCTKEYLRPYDKTMIKISARVMIWLNTENVLQEAEEHSATSCVFSWIFSVYLYLIHIKCFTYFLVLSYERRCSFVHNFHLTAVIDRAVIRAKCVWISSGWIDDVMHSVRFLSFLL